MKNVFLQLFALVVCMLSMPMAFAATLIPAGSLSATLGDITDTGADAFGLVVPVVIGIWALFITVSLIKRFMSKAG